MVEATDFLSCGMVFQQHRLGSSSVETLSQSSSGPLVGRLGCNFWCQHISVPLLHAVIGRDAILWIMVVFGIFGIFDKVCHCLTRKGAIENLLQLFKA